MGCCCAAPTKAGFEKVPEDEYERHVLSQSLIHRLLHRSMSIIIRCGGLEVPPFKLLQAGTGAGTAAAAEADTGAEGAGAGAGAGAGDVPVIHNLEPPPKADGDNTNDDTWAASRDLGSAKLTVGAEDLEAFYDYARVFAAFLHSHHHHEDEIIFISANKKCPSLMTTEAKEHVILDKTMAKLDAEIAMKPTLEGVKRIAALVYAIMAFLIPHFGAEEIKLNLTFAKKYYKDGELPELEKSIMKAFQKEPEELMVFVCYHLVLEKERGLLADVPGIVRNFLFPRWAGKAKWTRYAPFVTRDAGGKLIFG